jgi:hypothetical protein
MTHDPRSRTRASTFALAIALASGSALGAPIAWKNSDAPSIVGQRVGIANPTVLVRQSAQRPDGAHIIVALGSNPDAQTRADLAAKGLELLSPVGSGAYFAHVKPGADAAALSGALVGAEPITRAHKLHPSVANDQVPSWAVLSKVEEGADPSDAVVAAYVKLFDTVSASDPSAERFVTDLGGSVRSIVMSVNTLVVEMPASALKRLADNDSVQWIEPPIPAFEDYNDSNRAVTQVNTVNSAPYGLDGSGVTVFVYDGGTIRTTHNDFSGRATNIDSDGVSFHATHVAGTIGGDGSVNANNRGMAPGVTLLGAGFEQPGGLSQGFLYTDPGDLESDYALALSMGADLSNNSIGSNVAPNGYPCSWEGDYGLTAATIDAVVRGSLGEPITIFWAAGNERGSGRCGSTYNTTPPPSNNKNAISIGAVNSNDGSMTSFSSWGPSDDGRIRPTISAPGCQSSGDFGVTSTDSASDSAYTSLCGTSMASPTAAGIGALLLEDFRANFPGYGDPSNQLVKAILVHTAQDRGNTGPDYQYGYGMIQAQDAIDFSRTGNWEEGEVDMGSSATFSINSLGSEDEIKITLVWDDVPGTPNVGNALVNDLDLVVTSPSGTRHYPWTLNPASPAAAASRSSEDHLNNIEQVVIDNPEPGLYQVSVAGTNVAQGPQSFAIAATPELGDGFLAIGLVSTTPDLILPQTTIDVQAAVSEGMDTLLGGVTLHYRNAAGAFTSVPMTETSGLYEAQIPGASCDEFIEYYVSAQGQEAGAVFSPPAGASDPVRVDIGEVVTILSDNMETDQGWTVSGNALDGQWTRGVPVNCSSRGAPGADSDGSGQCWLTDNSSAGSCNSDVDDGSTILTSPVYDLSDGGEFSYDYWFADIPTGAINGDSWIVEVSTNGGSSWNTIRTITSVSGSWRTDTISVGTEVAATDQMRFRFTANDLGSQNVIEAGLDNIRVTSFVCEDTGPVCVADFNSDGDLDFFDVSAFLQALGNQNQSADINEDGSWDFFDVSAFLQLFNQGCP